MNKTKKQVTLDVNSPGIGACVYARQTDVNSRCVLANLVCGQNAIDPSEYESITARARLPDGTVISLPSGNQNGVIWIEFPAETQLQKGACFMQALLSLQDIHITTPFILLYIS